MRTDSADIDKQQLAHAISAAYGLDITSIAFLPKGEDAYAYLAKGSDRARYFVRVQAVSRAGALEPVYKITHALHTRYELSPVVAPYATRQGMFSVSHGAYTVAVFPFIKGRTLYDQGASDADLAQAAAIVAALHESSAARDIQSLQREAFENPFRAPILRALQTADESSCQANHYQREVLSLLATERADVLATLDKMDQLGARALELPTVWVLTHGDPNLDNLLKDDQGKLHLTDWDAIAVGPPERDLFAFTGEGFEVFLRSYAGAKTTVELHKDIFAFYFYRWTVQEIADYSTRILFGNMGPEEDEHAWEELQPYLPVPHDGIAQGLQALQSALDKVLGQRRTRDFSVFRQPDHQHVAGGQIMDQSANENAKLPQPDIVARNLTILKVDGLFFKDLNKNGRLDPYEDWRRPIEERIDDLLAQMTLEEKAGLMVHPALEMGEGGTLREKPLIFPISRDVNLVASPGTSDALLNRHITHVLTRSAEPPDILATWNNNLQELAERSRLGIPVTISSDPRNGFRHDPNATSVRAGAFSQWPEPIGLAATRDPEVVEQFGAIVAQEYKATGIRTALHPMADLATEPRWGRIVGTFGEDAELSASMTAAYIRGFQGEGGLSPNSVATMTKHFPGGGAQLKGLDPHHDYGKEQVYPGGYFDYHLIPFKTAIEARTAQMMPYYGIPMDVTSENVGMGFNKDILTGLLREELGFAGVICTDWGITSLMPWGVEDLTVEQRYRKAIEAGADQFGGDHTPEIIVSLVKSGEISEARIDESARRLLRDKFSLGLFENPYVSSERAKQIVGSAEFQAAADLAQRKSIVLLKNQAIAGGKMLPLDSGAQIYIENVNPAVAADYGSVVENVNDAEVAILRLSAPYRKGQGFFGFIHEGSLAFQGEELERLQKIMRVKPTIVAIFLDRPAVLPEIAELAAGLLATFGASDEAILDVVFGRFAPTGKLPFELPSSVEAVERQKEDVPCDSENPLFEFGFGLTY